MTMKLDPAKYECEKHQTDLTAQVQDALEDDSPPLAYARRPMPGRRAAGGPFAVLVTCPGNAGSSKHSLICNGTWTP